MVSKKYEFKNFIKDKKGKKHVCFLGAISVGKSTLCNMLFGTKL
jgi:GTPase Era involved in 16S rRNA processing